MKLKYIISFFALVALLASCSEENTVTLLDEIQVSSSMVAIDVEGGSTTITLNAGSAWVFNEEEIPEWLTVSPMAGVTGESKVTFSAPETEEGRSAVLHIECGGKTQTVNVMQGLPVVTDATCADVINGPESKTYRVTGTCVKILNKDYGNWDLSDGTGTIRIYGTLDKKGSAGKNNSIKDWGIEEGDILTVEGPKLVYGSIIELVDVTVVKLQKWMVQVKGYSPADQTIPLEGGTLSVNLVCKSKNGISVEIPEKYKDWLSIVSVASGANPVVTFKALPNMGGDRSADVLIKTTDDEGQEYSAQATIIQKGAIKAVTVAEFLEEQVGDSQYRMTGVLQSMYRNSKGDIKGFRIRDYSGETVVYNPAGFTGTEAKMGDIVTVVGKRDEYNGSPQMGSGTLEDVKPVTQVTIAEFLAKPEDRNVYYMVTGTIIEIKDALWGNLFITDGSGTLYVYGTYPGWGATGDNRHNWLSTANIGLGDELTVIGVRGTRDGGPALYGGFYYSHEKAD